jgi:hypothetical protein
VDVAEDALGEDPVAAHDVQQPGDAGVGGERGGDGGGEGGGHEQHWKNLPPTNSAISGRVSSVMLKLATFGKTDWAIWPATRKMPPPMSRVMMIALLMWDLSRASSEYMVIASKPMKEKQTMVAPVSTAGRATPEWNSGWVLNTVPVPMPWVSCMTASPMNATIMTTANTTRVKFTFEVEFRLQTFKPGHRGDEQDDPDPARHGREQGDQVEPNDQGVDQRQQQVVQQRGPADHETQPRWIASRV